MVQYKKIQFTGEPYQVDKEMQEWFDKQYIESLSSVTQSMIERNNSITLVVIVIYR